MTPYIENKCDELRNLLKEAKEKLDIANEIIDPYEECPICGNTETCEHDRSFCGDLLKRFDEAL